MDPFAGLGAGLGSGLGLGLVFGLGQKSTRLPCYLREDLALDYETTRLRLEY